MAGHWSIRLFGCPRTRDKGRTRIPRSSLYGKGAIPGNSSQARRFRQAKQQDILAREAVAAWINERTETTEVRELAMTLFMEKRKRRQKLAFKLVDNLQSVFRQRMTSKDPAVEDPIADDGVFLAVHAFAAQSDAWFGGDAWPNAIMLQASVPGMTLEEVERIVRRDLAPQAVSAEEVAEVVEAFVSATWGGAIDTAELSGVSSVMISTAPQFAAIQYCIGVLWGYALRGLVLRLALDRALGTLPDTLGTMQQRLERQLEGGNTSGAMITGKKVSLLDYANDFFGHEDWESLCRPSDAAVNFLDAELEESLPALAMLTGNEESDVDVGVLLGEDDDDTELELEDMIFLPSEDWEAFQRRSVALGALLADAEALVDTEVGPLSRGSQMAQAWVNELIRGGALTGPRREQGITLISRLNEPLHRLADALRNNLLSYKIRSARRGLERLYRQNDTGNEEPASE